jgi:hypothetical protein
MLGRKWALHVQTNAVSDFSKSFVPVFPVHTVQALTEAQRNIERIHRLWEEDNDIGIPGGQLSALSFFVEGVQPSWEDPRCEGTIIMMDAEPHTVLKLFESSCLYAVGESSDYSNQAYGVRLVRRRDDAYRVELWTKLNYDRVFQAYLPMDSERPAPVYQVASLEKLRANA